MKTLPTASVKEETHSQLPTDDEEHEEGTSSNKVPKAVQAARDFMEQHGGVSKDSLKQLPSKLMNTLSTVFRSSLQSDQKGQYRNLQGTDAKHEWILQFIADPDKGQKTGYTNFKAFDPRPEDQGGNEKDQVWKTHALPASHTCDNTLDLPEDYGTDERYSSRK